MWRVWKRPSLGTEMAQSVKCLLSKSNDQSLIPRRHKALCGDVHLYWENRKRGVTTSLHQIGYKGAKGPWTGEKGTLKTFLYTCFQQQKERVHLGIREIVLLYNQGC